MRGLYLRKNGLVRKFKENIDEKATITGQKWDNKLAVKQLKKVISRLKNMSGLNVIKDKNGKEKVKAFPNIETLKKDDKAYKAAILDKNLEDYAGWEHLPQLCLKLLIEYPYVNDLVKHDTIKWEYHYHKEEQIKEMKDRYFGAYAALVSQYVVKGLKTQSQSYPENLFLSGYLGPLEFEELRAMADAAAGAKKGASLGKKNHILFPGLSQVHASPDGAKAKFRRDDKDPCQSKHKDVRQVIFKIEGIRRFKCLGDGQFTYRMLGEVYQYQEKEIEVRDERFEADDSDETES